MSEKLSEVHVELFKSISLNIEGLLFIDKGKMPKLCQKLLAHNNDMTPTLMSHYDSMIHLSVIKMGINDDVLSREVLLKLNKNDQIVEYGAIKIYLNHFEIEARKLIEQAKIPLGQILADFSVKHHGQSNHFFQVSDSSKMKKLFGNSYAEKLYGRCNTIYSEEKRPLAHIIEILPDEENGS